MGRPIPLLPRMLLLPLLLALTLAGAASMPGAQIASGQTAQASFEASVENRYPGSIAFHLSAEAPANIAEATLYYSVIGRGSSAVGRPGIAEPATAIEVTVEVTTNSQNSFIPVGSEFLYYWQVTLADGSVAVGDEGTFLYLPPDEEWEVAANDFMEVYYHGDRASLADDYLVAAEATYEQIGELLNVELTQVPVRVILFADEADMSLARPGRGETFDAAVTTCGTRVERDIVYVIPIACAGTDHTDTLRHEFAHILTAAAGETALVQMPAWLDEGTAVLAQSVPGEGYVGAFNAAVQTDRLIPFSRMSTPSNQSNEVNLFYGQSFAMVTYLLDVGGPESFAELFAFAKAGNRFDTALEEVYGFDLATFEREFRESHGLSSGDEPDASPTEPARQDPDPTPTAVAPAQGASNDDGSGLSTTTLGMIGLAVVFALVAVFFYLFSLMLQSRRVPANGRPTTTPSAEEPRVTRPERDEDLDDRWGPPS